MSLPLPIALLRRRARNAKSPKERHDTAYFAWEASVRLTAAEVMPPDGMDLSSPSVGHFVRWLGTRDDDTMLDDEAALATFVLLTEVGTDRKVSTPKAVSSKKLVEALGAYRNRVLGHGSTRENAFYQESAEILLHGLDAAWKGRAFSAPENELVWVESVELASSGKRKARILSLMGLASEADDVDDAPEDVRPRRVYVKQGKEWTALHPWVLFEGTELRERVLFFNGRPRSARFLDYVSGEEVKGKVLQAAFEGIEDQVAAALDVMQASGPGERGPRSLAGREPADPNAFGDYRLLGKLGEGGMGVVHLAEQKSLSRVVALKMLPKTDDAIAVKRFEREIAALSKCEHPNIVKILSSGVQDGTNYYAMEFVDGVDLAQVSPQLTKGNDFDSAVSTASDALRAERKELFENLPSLKHHKPASSGGAATKTPIPNERALVMLFRDAAYALDHLHENGIVHRDVKPSNLMVTSIDHRLVLMDLGLAAVDNASKTLTRDASSILGTLRYMPPEQLQRNLLDVDHRADIYALGVTFYELLTGRPFLDGDSEARLIEQILRQDPMPPGKANPKLPRDLCVILEKATQKDAKERYTSAAALAADLEAFLEGKPIAARPPTLRYLFWLALKRNKAVAISAFVVFALFNAGVITYFLHERELRREADLQRLEAQRQSALAESTSIDLLTEQGRAAIEERAHGRALVLLAGAYERGGRDIALRHLLARELMDIPSPIIRRDVHKGPVRCLAFSNGGARIASGGEDGVVVIADSTRGTTITKLDAKAGAVRSLSFSSDGERLVSLHADGTARTWDTLAARPLAVIKTEKGILAADWDPNGRELATAGEGGATIWDASTGARVVDLVGHRGPVVVVRYALFYQEAGRTLLTGGDDGTARLWSATGKSLATFQGTARISDVAFTGTKRVVTGSDDGTVSLWNDNSAKGAKPLHTIQVGRPVRRIIPAPGFASATHALRIARSDRVVQRWDLDENERGAITSKLVGTAGGLDAPIIGLGDQSFVLQGHALGGGALVRDDGSAVVELEVRHRLTVGAFHREWGFGTDDGSVLLLPTETASDRTTSEWGPILAADRGYGAAAFAPDGVLLVMGDGVFHGAGGALLVRAEGGAGLAEPAFAGAFTATSGGRVIDLRTGAVVTKLNKRFDQLALAPDASRVAGNDGDKIKVWEIPSGKEIASLAMKPVFLGFVDRDTLVAVDKTSCVKWNVVTSARGPSMCKHDGEILDASLSASGPGHEAVRLVTASADHTARIWNVDDGAELAVLRGHGADVVHALFTPNASTVVTAAVDRTAKVWDATTGALQSSLEGHSSMVHTLAVAPDGIRIATGDASGIARIWDARTGKLLTRLQMGPSWILSLAFSPSGSALAGSFAGGELGVRDTHLESRSDDDVKKLVLDRALPWRLTEGRLVFDPIK